MFKLSTLVFGIFLIVTSAAAVAEGTERLPAQPPDGLALATFAGGCFWCMEAAYEKVDGVTRVISGYTGGHVPHPTYHQVSAGGTGHAESVRVIFDPDKVSYAHLLYVFWRNIDPVAKDRQFCDVGHQYRTAIFYHDERQHRLAEESLQKLADSGRFQKPITTEIEAAGPFYKAEAYHQNYYRTHTARYQYYRLACGRDKRLHEIWGDQATPQKEGHSE